METQRMPVGCNGVGESENTPIKNETVSALFAAWCNQVSAICKRMPRRVRYVDLTAGCGAQCDGKPTFIGSVRGIAKRHGLDIAMMACEQNVENADRLRENVQCEHVLTVRWQDAFHIVDAFTRGAFTFVYHDPNACRDEHMSLVALASDISKADFCLHFDANQIKRIRCANFSVTPIDQLVTVREHCLIREPFGKGAQWTVMYLSNCCMNGYSKYGFYKLGAGTGDALLEQIKYTKKERVELNRRKNKEFRFEY